MACEKCWGDAYMRSLVNGKSQAENYSDLLRERKDNPCPNAWGETMRENAWVARIQLHTPGRLLGGEKTHTSAPFADRRDAVSFAEQSIQTNRMRPGHSLDVMTYDVFPVHSANSIPATNEAFGTLDLSQIGGCKENG